eukprot:scaffold1729_cov117-Cylindrotheca_fusiformis.AAC.9
MPLMILSVEWVLYQSSYGINSSTRNTRNSIQQNVKTPTLEDIRTLISISLQSHATAPQEDRTNLATSRATTSSTSG